jgi:hypothetical protein
MRSGQVGATPTAVAHRLSLVGSDSAACPAGAAPSCRAVLEGPWVVIPFPVGPVALVRSGPDPAVVRVGSAESENQARVFGEAT